MNCLKSTPRTLISSQRASYKPLVSSRSPEFTVQIHTDSLLPSMPPTHSSVFRSKSSCVAPPLHRPKAEALTQLRSRARTWWHFLRDFLSLSHCSRISWWDQCWHIHANSASKHLNNRKGCRMHWCNKNRTGLAWFRVKPSVATAFCGGWKIPLLINNPNVSIWSKRLKHSWAAACSNRDDTLQCPLHVAVPIYHCPRNPSAQATERKKKTHKRHSLNKNCQHPSPNSFPAMLQGKNSSSCSQSTKSAALHWEATGCPDQVLLPWTGLRQVP